ncbi:MAG: T9SS type A sorting domain-containing protein [Bacteroidetes bacterium]|nr:T9SS type A sorting domain-containing protein [Bacteroidota bacterium]
MKLLISIILICPFFCLSQNLIPNGSFEVYSSCPSFYSQIDSALYWFSPTVGTPDYYNSCATNFAVSIPNNYSGYQNAIGSGFTGIILLHTQAVNTREYIETQLSSPLLANQSYYFKMYVNIADKSEKRTDAIGVYFSDTLIAGFAPATVLPFIPNISNTSGLFLDSINWRMVSGIYSAHGGEQFVVIGNFKTDTMTSTLPNNNFIDQVPVVYAFIDSVTLTSVTSIEDQLENEKVQIYPNPFNDNIFIRLRGVQGSEIIIYEITSRVVLKQNLSAETTLYTTHLESGTYFYQIRKGIQLYSHGRLIKN